jgi:hypothetical protein
LSGFAQQHAALVQIRPVVVTPEEFRIAYPKVQALDLGNIGRL